MILPRECKIFRLQRQTQNACDPDWFGLWSRLDLQSYKERDVGTMNQTRFGFVYMTQQHLQHSALKKA